MTKQEKRKFEIDFETKSFIVMWDTLEMIYGFFDSIEQEQINTQGEEDENTSFKCFSKVRNIKNYIRTLVTKQCL